MTSATGGSCRWRPRVEFLEERTAPAVFTVNSTLDLPDSNPGDGLAQAIVPGTGEIVTTLRAAIMEANALSGPDTINLPAGNYDLTIKGPNEDAGHQGDLDITDHLSILGEGADKTIVRADPFGAFAQNRILDVRLNSPGQTLLKGFSVIGGDASSLDGNDGGGVRVQLFDPNASLTLDGLHIDGNNAVAKGGGVHIRSISGMTTINNSTISNNSAADGGGISVDIGEVYVNNSTISSNVAMPVNHATGQGGGVFTGSGSIFLIHATVVYNLAARGGGLYTSPEGTDSGTLHVCNTIVALNKVVAPHTIIVGIIAGPDLYGVRYFSHGGNLISDNSDSSGFANGVNWDIVGDGRTIVVDPLLGPLELNGGTTPTHLLLAGSPALNNAYGKFGLPNDQRGFGRPFGPLPDIGAVELQETPATGTDLVVDITTPNGLVRPGRKIKYTILVTNAGPSTATKAQLSLLLPENAKYLGFTSSIGYVSHFSGRDMVLDLGDMAVGVQATITVSVKMRRVGLAALEATGSTQSNEADLQNNRDVAYHFAGRPLYIDDRILTLLLGRPTNGFFNGNGNGNAGRP